MIQILYGVVIDKDLINIVSKQAQNIFHYDEVEFFTHKHAQKWILGKMIWKSDHKDEKNEKGFIDIKELGYAIPNVESPTLGKNKSRRINEVASPNTKLTGINRVPYTESIHDSACICEMILPDREQIMTTIIEAKFNTCDTCNPDQLEIIRKNIMMCLDKEYDIKFYWFVE